MEKICILQKPVALCTNLGGLKHFIRVWFHFCGADVLSTNYFLQITCSLSLLASAFSRQHIVNGAERCKQEHLENLSHCGWTLVSLLFCKQLELPVHMRQVFMGKIFHSCLIIFICIRLDGVIMEKCGL